MDDYTADNERLFTDEERRTLLRIARESIQAELSKSDYQPQSGMLKLKMEHGVFVTLKKHGQLRGCLGRFDPNGIPLENLVAIMAVESATHDYRFSPIQADELAEVDIQISVLTPLQRVNDVNEIIIGKHGLQVRGFTHTGIMRSGTLLPQVAKEHQWDVETFLKSTCQKAGLAPDAWKEKDTEIYIYSAEIFGDLDYGEPPFGVQ